MTSRKVPIQSLIDHIKTAIDVDPWAKEMAEELLKKQPEVVRCKECKHCYYASNRMPEEQSYACAKFGIDVMPDWFCADGEKERSVNEKRVYR